MTPSDEPVRPPARTGRIVVALIGLVLGLILINGGLNLLSRAGDDQPAPVSTTPAPTAVATTGPRTTR